MGLKDGDILNRADKVAFMGLIDNATTYNRMHGFTDMGKSANPSEYSRRYVDERTERSDVTGYAPEIGYGFDQTKGDKVQQVIVDITDDELTGKKVTIVTVDFSQEGAAANTYVARKREYSVIPDSDGDSTDAYTYSGSFKAAGDIVKGTASSTDNWETCSFTADADSDASNE